MSVESLVFARDDDRTHGHGFHPGQLAVQRAAGVQQSAARLEGMLQPARLGPGVRAFLSDRRFAALTARDVDGLLWCAPLVAEPGFIQVADPSTLHIHASPDRDGPLGRIAANQPVGLIVIDYRRRRRFRINGRLAELAGERLTVEVSEAFGNCPQYLPRRTLDNAPSALTDRRVGSAVGSRSKTLGHADHATIRGADTFILGTTHPERGSDASHRGGPPGFVRTEGHTVWWPDFAGNNMFTSLGNLAVDNEAALLFFDVSHHRALHLSGTAALSRVAIGSPDDDGRTGRRVVFTTRHVARSVLARATSDL